MFVCICETGDLEKFYEKYGFTKLPKPEIYMEKFNPNVYRDEEKTNANNQHDAIAIL